MFRVGGGVQFSKAVERPVYTSEKKNGAARIKIGRARINFTCKRYLAHSSFARSVQKRVHRCLFRNATDKNRFRTHFFLLFFFQRVNARPLFGTDPRRFFLSLWSFYVSRLLQSLCVLRPTAPYIFAAKWRVKIRKLPHEKLQQKRLNLGKIMKSQCCLIRSFKNTSLSHRIHCYCA